MVGEIPVEKQKTIDRKRAETHSLNTLKFIGRVKTREKKIGLEGLILERLSTKKQTKKQKQNQ